MRMTLAATITALALAVALAAPATPAESEPGASMRTVVVQGNGESQASPDLADLSLQIETHAPTAEQATSRNAALAQKVVSALKDKLGAKGKVWTGGYSLTPDYEQRPGGERPRIVGYNAQNSIIAETGDLTVMGALIDSAIAAGANRVNYLNFSLKDDTKARSDAIAAASRDAQAQAHALAASLGVKLVRVIKASTVSELRPIPMAREVGFAMAAKVSTPVEPGQVTVPATVSLTYEIE
jgi:uncharacterized protein